MTWGYRIVKQLHPTETYQAYEIHYDENDNIQYISAKPSGPYGETLEEITNDLEHMRQALSLPILDMDEVVKALETSGATEHTKTDWARIDAMKDEDIDFSDIPELGDDSFEKAVVFTEPRTDIVRIISMRKATKNERTDYEKRIKD